MIKIAIFDDEKVFRDRIRDSINQESSKAGASCTRFFRIHQI